MKTSIIIIVAISVLAGLWFWALPQTNNDLTQQETSVVDQSMPDAAENARLDGRRKLADSDFESQQATETRVANEANNDTDFIEVELDEDYIKYVLDFRTPIVDAHRGLIRLVNQGNGDAMLALMMSAEDCRFQEDKEKYCPGTGLPEYGASLGAKYVLLLEAAKNGSLTAMMLLIDTPPAPFVSMKDFRENKIHRLLNANAVALHNAASREYLEYAAQKGLPGALVRSAELYAYGGIVDPDPEKAIFYTLAALETSGLPVPPHMQKMIDQLDTKKYNNILKRAKSFAAQFEDVN